MKKSTVKSAVLLVAAGVAVGAGIWYVVFDDKSVAQQGDGSYLSVVDTSDSKNPNKKARRGSRIRKGERGVRIAQEKVRPDLKLEAEDESKLTAQMLEIYRALQEALDKDDSKRVFALVHKLQGMKEWPDGIPMVVKKRALSALAWFGAPGIAEAIGFLADSSEEIRSDAIETFKKQFEDSWDYGDVKLSETLIAMAKVVTDAEALESFYEQFSNMRPSIRASTVAEIYQSGSDEAKKVLDDNLSAIFASDETSVESRDDVDNALKAAQQEEAKEKANLKDGEKSIYDEMYGRWDW